MPESLALVLSLLALAGTLAAAVTRRPWLPEAVVAACGAALLVALGAISLTGARHALGALGPTVGFLAALLVLADGCPRGAYSPRSADGWRTPRAGERHACWR